MSAKIKIVEKRKQRLLKREKGHLVISHRKFQSYCCFQTTTQPVLYEVMLTHQLLLQNQYQQNRIFNNLFISQYIYTDSSISEPSYQFFDTSKTCKILVSRCYSSTTRAKNSSANLTAKVFIESKSNKLLCVPEPTPEFVCH